MGEKKKLLFIIWCLCMFSYVACYPYGAPYSSCSNMIPEHGSSPQTSTNPYEVVLPKTTYSANEQMQVTLRGKTGNTFRGFLIQARNNVNTAVTYGTISNAPTSTVNPCVGMSALTHTTSSERSSISFTWTAPASNSGNIVFVYSVVQTERVYWVKQTSATLTYQPIANVQNTTTSSTKSTSDVQSTQVTTKKPSAMGITKDGECGKTVGCFHNCDSSDRCGFLLTWVDKGDNIDLTLSCDLGGGEVYCAIGLSSDDKMGDDSVFQCVSNGNQVSVSLSYNNGRSNYLLDQKLGISAESTKQDNGVITCSFLRKKSFALATSGRKKRETVSASTYFDMNNDWTLMYAYGKSIPGYLTQHDTTPTLSSQVADFQSVMDISATETESKLVKAHGILMTLAWLFFATLGIFMARFYKTVWPQGMEWFKQKRWFQVHRACMVLTLILTAIGFIIIFVDVRGYADMAEDNADNFDKSHPILGIIIMGLVVINPIMALFRPHPGTPQRPVFNVAHTVVGMLAHVLGIVNLFSGTGLSAAHTPSYVWILLYIFVAWMLLLEVISQLYERNKKEPKANAYEMKNGGTEVYQEIAYQSVSRFKLVILGLHVVVLTGLVIAVCVIIGVN